MRFCVTPGPLDDAATLGRARCPQRAERSRGSSQLVPICSHGASWKIMRRPGDRTPYQDASPLGRARCPQRAERSRGSSQFVPICSHGVSWKIMRHRRDAAPYQDAAPMGRARRPRRAESNTAGPACRSLSQNAEKDISHEDETRLSAPHSPKPPLLVPTPAPQWSLHP